MNYKKLIIMGLVVTLVVIIIINTTLFKYMIMDRITRSKLETLHQSVRAQFIAFVDECSRSGWHIVITRSYSSFSEQAAIQQLYSVAVNPGDSSHNYGMAIDCNFYNGKVELTSNSTREEWESSGITAIAKKNGLRWGGDFDPYDPVHFDSTRGKTDIAKYKALAYKQFGTNWSDIKGNKIQL